MHILCIEDSPVDSEIIKRMTEAAHHQGTFVRDLQSAREVLEELTPDLIFVDIVLNTLRVGDEFVRELRANGFSQPIIAVTALALPHEIKKCLDSGFTEVLTKPYEIRQLAGLFTRYRS